MIAEFATLTILAAFLAGLLAFFAPCCITFMLPSYFAFAFKEKAQILKMTFVFMLGLMVVFLPIALALAGIGVWASQFHTQLFFAAGIFLIVMAILVFLGKTLRMPFQPKAPNMKQMDTPAVFQLGIFSGLASSCCLPVLAGVLTLGTLSASYLQAGILVWAYVLGMTVPLLFFALVWDKWKLGEHKIVQGKMIEFNFFGKKQLIHSSNLIAGVILLLMGFMTLYIAFENKVTVVDPNQMEFALLIRQIEQTVSGKLSWIPDSLFLVLVILATMILLIHFLKKEKPITGTLKNSPIKKLDCCKEENNA